MNETVREIPLMVPDIGDSDKIDLVQWNVQVGDSVVEGQELCDLVTDKASFPLECPKNGTILRIEKPAGSHVRVGETLAILVV